MLMGRSEGTFVDMGFDKGRRGRGRDKRDRFGEDEFDPFFAGQDRFGGGGGGGGGMPAQVVGQGRGVVKFFNAAKGFGFITRDDGQPDAFVHISAVERSGMSGLNEGDRVEFDIEVDRRGKYSAVNLTALQA